MRLNILKIATEKITLSQRKIIIIALILLSVNLFFWLFIYFPGRNTVARIKANLSNVESQLREIEAIIGKTESVDESIRLLSERCEELNRDFPQKEEECIRALSKLARELDIELISIKPQPKEVFLDKDKTEVRIEGMTCQRVLVSLEISCFYKDLVKYIEALKGRGLGFATIERLKITRNTSRLPRLYIVIDINLHLLS